MTEKAKPLVVEGWVIVSQYAALKNQVFPHGIYTTEEEALSVKPRGRKYIVVRGRAKFEVLE
jgi:hypothetical protein